MNSCFFSNYSIVSLSIGLSILIVSSHYFSNSTFPTVLFQQYFSNSTFLTVLSFTAKLLLSLTFSRIAFSCSNNHHQAIKGVQVYLFQNGMLFSGLLADFGIENFQNPPLCPPFPPPPFLELLDKSRIN